MKGKEKLANRESREHFSNRLKHKNHVSYSNVKPWRFNAITEDAVISFYYERCLYEKQNRQEKATAKEYSMGTLIFY